MQEHSDQDFGKEGQSPFDLSQWDEEYESAPIEERDFEPLPDGKYQVVVDRVELTAAQTSGRPMLKWTLKVLAPSHVGRLLWRNNMIASADNIRWLKNDLHTCGMKLGKLSELPDKIEKLLDTRIEVTLKTRGDNQNIYFNRLISSGDSPEGEARDRDMDRQAEELFR